MGSPYNGRWLEYSHGVVAGGGGGGLPVAVKLSRGGGWSRADRCGQCGKGGDHECSVAAVHLLAAPAVLACGAPLPRSLAEVRPRIPGGQLPEVVTCAECVTSALEEWPAAPVHHGLCDADTDHSGPCRCRCGSPAVYEGGGCVWHSSVRERAEKGDPDLPPEPLRGVPAGDRVALDAGRWRELRAFMSPQTKPMKDWPSEAGVGRRAMELAGEDPRPRVEPFKFPNVSVSRAELGLPPRPDLVHVADRKSGDEGPVCAFEYSGHDGPCREADLGVNADGWCAVADPEGARRLCVLPDGHPLVLGAPHVFEGPLLDDLAEPGDGPARQAAVASWWRLRVLEERASAREAYQRRDVVEPRTGLPWLHDVDVTQCVDSRRVCVLAGGHDGACRGAEWLPPASSSPEVRAEVSAGDANRLLDHFGVSTRMRQCESTIQPLLWRGHPVEGSPRVRCERIVGHAGDHRSPEGTTWALAEELEPAAEPGPEPGPVGLTADEVEAAVRKALRAYDVDRAAFQRELNRRLLERAEELRDRLPDDERVGFLHVGEDGKLYPLPDPRPEETSFSRRRDAADPVTPWRAAWARLTGATAPQVPAPGTWEPGVAAVSDTEPGPDYDPPAMALEPTSEGALLSDLCSAHVAVTELTHGFRDLLVAVLGRGYADLLDHVGPSPEPVAGVDRSAQILVTRLRRLAVQVAAARDEAEGR